MIDIADLRAKLDALRPAMEDKRRDLNAGEWVTEIGSLTFFEAVDATLPALLDELERARAVTEEAITEDQVTVVWDYLELDDVGHLTRGNVRAALDAARQAGGDQ